MTDAEMVRLCGEKVMGYDQFNFSGTIMFTKQNERGQHCTTGWRNPLTRDADSGPVLDKMAADGWDYYVEKEHGGVECVISRGWVKSENPGIPGHPEHRGACSFSEYSPENRRRAIVLAALKAKGLLPDE